jgi:cytohesin
MFDLTDLLVRSGSNLEARDIRGETALSHAVTAGNLAAVHKLLELGADVDTKNNEGRSVLMKSLDRLFRNWNSTDEDILTLLLGAGPTPASFRDARGTALDMAVENRCPLPLLERFLTLQWNQAEMDGALLSAASSYQDDKVLDLLLRSGANVNAKDDQGQTPLHKTRTSELLSLLLSAGADVNTRDHQGRTCLFSFRSEEEVELLLKAGADATAIDDNGRTPLHETGSAASLSLLISAGADVNARDHQGRTCLFSSPQEEAVGLLLKAGADATTVDHNGRTPLHEAGNAASLLLLLSAGADINARDHQGRTPLLSQMSRGPDQVRTLLEAGADATLSDNAGNTPLMAALTDGRYAPLIALFLEKGADPNTQRADGQTQLMFLTRRPTKERRGYWANPPSDVSAEILKDIEMWLSFGADADKWNMSGKSARDYAEENSDPKMKELLETALEKFPHPRPSGRTPLMLAALESEDTAFLARLMNAGEELEARDHYGWTALMHAAWANPNPEIARFLINQGADVNAEDHLSRTPLMVAAWHNANVEIFKVLVEAGALLNRRDLEGNSAVEIALKSDQSEEVLRYFLDVGSTRTDEKRLASDMLLAASVFTPRPEAIRMLLAGGASVNARGPDGQTPLMKAVAQNRSAVVEVLIDAGADVNAKDNKGVSVLDCALRGDNAVLQMLLDAGIELEEDSVWWKVWEKMWLLSRYMNSGLRFPR